MGRRGRLRVTVDLGPLSPVEDEQGESPFVWSVIGAISAVCSLPIATAVDLPDDPCASGDRGPGSGDERRAHWRKVHPWPHRRRFRHHQA
jgi:hypothetical protein